MVQERGFDEAFAEFCAKTFSSFSYPPESLAAARMHAYYLRLFLEERVNGRSLSGVIPESLLGAFREAGERAIRETLSREHPSGVDCCRAFVRSWCKYYSKEC